MPQIDDTLRSELAALAAQKGCELLSVELSHDRLRVVLDREDGSVGIEDCTFVSRQASALLDVHDFGDRRYTLEVSSPGLDRPLLGPRDYARFRGQLARVTFTLQGEGKRTVVGHLDELVGGEPPSDLRLIEKDTETAIDIPIECISAARLEIDL